MAALAIRHAFLIDGKGEWHDQTTLVIHGDRIVWVGSDSAARLPKNMATIDGRGKALLPGLIDCHVHYCLDAGPDPIATFQQDDPTITALKAATHAQATLNAGITTVRDVGSRNHISISLGRAIRGGVIPGPRTLSAGLAICMTGGHAWFIGREADGPAEVVKAVREQVQAGADLIKLIATGGVLTPGDSPGSSQLSFEELQAAVQEAAQAGRRVAAHAHGAEGMKNAILAGVHSIEHGTLLDHDALKLFLLHKTFLVPTLSAIQTGVECGKMGGMPAQAFQKVTILADGLRVNFQKAIKAGVRIAMGTDAGTPFNLHGRNAQELRRMVDLGLSPLAAIQAATSSASSLLGLEQEIGSIETGKLADIILVDGNPLDDITLLEDPNRIVLVMQGGKVVKDMIGEG